MFIVSAVLVFVSFLAILLVLMQRSGDGGIGGSLGGGAVESIFGGGAGDALTKLTVKIIVTFFVLSLLLSMLSIHNKSTISNRSAVRLPIGHASEVAIGDKQ
jgi:preprotein translocase subunit SecG